MFKNLSCLKPNNNCNKQLKLKLHFFSLAATVNMFHDLLITGRLRILRVECVYFCRQPLPVSRINQQILLREQSKQSLLILLSSVPVNKTLAGIPSQYYFSPGGWVHVCALTCMCQCDLFMCVFSQKNGVTEQIAWGGPTSALCLPTKADAAVAWSPLCIHLSYSWSGRTSSTPCSILYTE